MPPSDSHALAQQAYDSGSPALAAVLAERVLVRFGEHPPALLILAQASADLGRYPAALAAYDRFIAAVGAVTLATCNARGVLEEAAGELLAAEGWFRRAIELDPHDARGYIHLGALQASRGDLQAALATHLAGTGCAAGPVCEAWYNHWLVLRALGHYLAAKGSFDTALRLDPDYAEARRARADVIQASTQAGEA